LLQQLVIHRVRLRRGGVHNFIPAHAGGGYYWVEGERSS